MASPLRAVLVDADGVLQFTAPAWRDDVAQTVGHAEVSRHPRLLDEIAKAEGPGTMTGETDLEHSLTRVLDRHDVDLEPADVIDAWHNIELHADVVEGVRALRGRGLVLALTTNQNAPRAAWMHENLPYDEVFDAHFYSCEIGLAKPDPAYFTHVLEALGLAPGEALFLDDTAANVEAAAGLGIHAELFARDGGRAELDRILAAHRLA
ncbi:putative hydrolase of the HAD superfamily [Friedmanniella luteola]|uniref:Putative hydrolase of the HAD superfamily n=1 Tax=Friedmanniella luteola TaxID=546871 RepID=A0A1H1LD37_9ACTN|nr:HAD-IA family hydrolase [Friedmanniella luteola]SDR72474.1 putative hydrolase of the HAD superfamily [Friedmanniella luteola]